MRNTYHIIAELVEIGQRMGEHLRYTAKQHNDDTAFLLSQEWDLKTAEYLANTQGGNNAAHH